MTADQILSGGLIGYNCSHVYPHTNRSKLNFLVPDNLKGADMLMYEIFRSLGLRVRFRPVARDVGYTSYKLGDPLPIVGLSLKWKTWNRCDDEYLEETFDEWAGRKEGGKTHHWWADEKQDPEEDEGRYIDFLDVHWLNDWGHQEPQLTWIGVSDPCCLVRA
jgi:hypothetical protein